jgi:putative transposase
MSDHIHMCISIPPKYVGSNGVGYIKGKSTIQIARKYGGRRRNFTGENFWARGFFVSTVGSTKRWYGPISETRKRNERYNQMTLME